MALGVSEDQALELYDAFKYKAKSAEECAVRAAIAYLKSNKDTDQAEGLRYLREETLWNEALSMLQKARSRS